MKNGNRWIALSVLFAMMLTTLGAVFVQPAEASAKGRRNTTIALGALTGYALLKKKKGLAIAGAVGTAYAYKRYSNQKKRERTAEQRRVRWYQQRYGRNWRNYYRRGS
jgi:uncharacterized membrane protein YebE (DUF533 family)